MRPHVGCGCDRCVAAIVDTERARVLAIIDDAIAGRFGDVRSVVIKRIRERVEGGGK